MLQTSLHLLLSKRALLWTLSFQSGQVLNRNHYHAWYTVKSLQAPPLHPPFHKAEKNTSYLFSVKTYSLNHFWLKTKAWNNYQMYDFVAQTEIKKKKYADCQYLGCDHPPLHYPLKHLPPSHAQGKPLGTISPQYCPEVMHSRASS